MGDREGIRVVVADLHPVVRTGVRYMLAQTPDLDLVGEAANEHEVLALTQDATPDIVLLSTNLSAAICVRLVERIHQSHPQVRILVMTGSHDGDPVLELLSRGVGGYLSKEEPLERLVTAIRRVALGELGVLSGSVIARLVATDRPGARREISKLTGREREVLHLLAQGHDNEQIAHLLYLSTKTVKNHITNVYSKLGVRRRAEAVAWIWKHGLEDDS